MSLRITQLNTFPLLKQHFLSWGIEGCFEYPGVWLATKSKGVQQKQQRSSNTTLWDLMLIYDLDKQNLNKPVSKAENKQNNKIKKQIAR